MKALLAGGGTAGHTSPLLATADALRRLDPSVEVTALGTPKGLEVRVVPEAGYPLELIPPVPLPRRPNGDLARLPGRMRRTVREALEVVDRLQPPLAGQHLVVGHSCRRVRAHLFGRPLALLVGAGLLRNRFVQALCCALVL